MSRSRNDDGRRAGLLAGLVLGLASLLVVTPAQAHEDHGDARSAAEHAQQDLAGQSVTAIERRTRARRSFLAARGRIPEVSARSSRGAGVAADPATSGSWGPVTATPVVPIFQAVLPDGKVLMWDSVGDGATESYPDHTFTRAMVWDPATGTSKRVDVQGYNIFCAGYAQLPNGNVLVVGGNKDAALGGIRQTHVFDWRTHTWSRGPDMAGERWYPSVTTTAAGESLIVAGGPDRAEVYADGTLRTLTGFRSFADRVYPFLVPRLDGRVEMVGPNTQLQTITPSGVGSATSAGTRDQVYRGYGSFATYAPGRTLVSGGSPGDQPPSSSAVVVTDDEAGGTRVAATGSMAFPRKQHNLTVLADGSVLATGGQRTAGGGGLVDLGGPVLAAERWDPASGAWTTLSSAARIRQYHSTASLLPDGRVLTGGGGICGACVQSGYLEKNLETFTPPYLFRRDGSGQLAARPQVSGVPGSVRVASTFTATSPQAADVRRIGLVRLGAPTHSVDQGQRFVPLSFTASGTTLTVQAPASTAVAPPGYYMMFAVDSAGVPSVASMVQVVPASGTTTPAVDLARGRPATASSVEASGLGVANAVDGSPTTRWSSAYSDNQWWQVDLGSTKSVDTVVTTWEAAYARRFQVQTSTDGSTWTTAATVDATSAGTQRTTFTSRSARYVRIQGVTRATGWGYSLWDVQVYGDSTTPSDRAPTASAGPDQTVPSGSRVTLDGSGSTDPEGAPLTYRWAQTGGPTVTLSSTTAARPTFTAPTSAGTLTFALTVGDGTQTSAADSVTVTVAAAAVDLARGRPATASSVEASRFAAGYAVDGSPTTRWSSRYSDNQWWQVDLGSSRSVSTVVTTWETAYARRFLVQTSTDGRSWTTAATVDATSAGTQRTTFSSRSARYVRIQGVTRATGWGYSLWDVGVYGS